MGKRWIMATALACLCLMTYGRGWAAPVAPVAWIALSESEGAYAETAAALRTALARRQPGTVEWLVAPWKELESRQPAPAYVVTVGTAAWMGAASRFADAEGAPVLLATLLPRASFERGLAAKARPRNISAVVLDHPATRQAQLVRLALPDARVAGLLLGPESRVLGPAFRNALSGVGLSVMVEDGGERGVSAGLQALLESSDLVLAIPDPAIFNSQTIAGILSSGYRRRIPLIGFSPAYVKAGALLALYSTPQQVGRAAADALREALAGRPLPAPHAPREFTVTVNQDVARSLGLSLDESTLNSELH